MIRIVERVKETYVLGNGQEVDLGTPVSGRRWELRLAVPEADAAWFRNHPAVQDLIDALGTVPYLA